MAQGVQIPRMVVPESLHRHIDFGRHNYLCDIPILGGVYLIKDIVLVAWDV